MNLPFSAIVAALPRNNAGCFHPINRTLHGGFGKANFYSDLYSGAMRIADHAIQNSASTWAALFRQEGKQRIYHLFLSLI